MHKPWIALIPLRGGSKSIPKKNIRLIGGKPLCYWSILSAVDSRCFREIWVSTDCPEIAHVVLNFGFESVKILMRPPELAQDDTPTESVMHHLDAHVDPYEVMVTLQATSPLTTAADLIAAQQQFQIQQADSLVTGVRLKRFIWDPDGVPLNYKPDQRPMRQQFSGSVMENGAFYFTKRHILQTTHCRLGGKISVFVLPDTHATELDEPEDWTVMSQWIRSRTGAAAPRLVFLDVDGVLTDGKMIYSNSGDELKGFHARDGKAIARLREAGIRVGFLTGESVPLLDRRAQKLGLDFLVKGSKDKVADAQRIASQFGLTLTDCAFIGDDEQDHDLLGQVGYAYCPSDAIQRIRHTKGITQLPTRGGDGVVRDFYDIWFG